LGESHPFPVLRLSELKTWLDSGNYEKILSGKYKRRQDEEYDDVIKEFSDAAQQYREDISKSKDPLGPVITKISEGIDEGIELFSKQTEDFLKSILEGL
jgi:hypothetical protein